MRSPTAVPVHRYEPERPRVGGLAAALALTAVTALILVVLPAATAVDPGTTTLATLGRAARVAFGML